VQLSVAKSGEVVKYEEVEGRGDNFIRIKSHARVVHFDQRTRKYNIVTAGAVGYKFQIKWPSE